MTPRISKKDFYGGVVVVVEKDEHDDPFGHRHVHVDSHDDDRDHEDGHEDEHEGNREDEHGHDHDHGHVPSLNMVDVILNQRKQSEVNVNK
ncbi:unnamed protein product [[Candida] boidinii]|nr:unnamed protein product [[Candida] boidinii]